MMVEYVTMAKYCTVGGYLFLLDTFYYLPFGKVRLHHINYKLTFMLYH